VRGQEQDKVYFHPNPPLTYAVTFRLHVLRNSAPDPNSSFH